MAAYEKYTADLAFDPGAFADDLNTVIVEPLRVTQALFGDFPYLTRLYTTLSAEEMTVDPMFSFNPDLCRRCPICTRRMPDLSVPKGVRTR